MNERLELTDELLLQALRQRTDVPVPSRLLARVMAGATGLSQERTARRWTLRPDAVGVRPIVPFSAIAGAVVAVVILVAVIALRPVLNVPGASPTTGPTPTAGPTPIVTASPPTPEALVLGTSSALRLRLGKDVAPIDVISAFDSIWIADIHANDVRRYEPSTMREIARIPVLGGPAWFVEADGALWVSTQLGKGVTRIDPATNSVVATVGNDPPCGAPFVESGTIWQAACDGDAFLHLDPTTNAVLQRYPAEAHGLLVAAAGAFYTSGPDGIARWDPGTGTFTDLPAYAGPSGATIASDGPTLWILGGSAVLRVDPSDGHAIATLPYPGALGITFDATRAWITSGTDGLIAIDLETNAEVQRIPVPTPWIPRIVDGVLWVTDFDGSVLWRIEP